MCPSPEARVLDYGCGEATSAPLLAEAAGALLLVEAAPNVRASLAARYASHPKIAVISADEASELPDQSFDLVVMHSVAQYLSAAELERLLGLFRRIVTPDGLVIIGDVVPPQWAAPAAALALLRFGAANGFFWAAAWRADPHLRVGLSAAEEDGRPVALHASRHAGEAAGGGLPGRARPAQYRP